MRTLLIVEDDPNLRKLYEAEFADAGYDAQGVASGEDAMRVIRTAPPDAVVLDVRLTGMSGLEVLRQVLEERPGIAVVLNSAYPAYKQNFASWSADGYVVKSSDLSELKTVVAGAIARRSAAA